MRRCSTARLLGVCLGFVLPVLGQMNQVHVYGEVSMGKQASGSYLIELSDDRGTVKERSLLSPSGRFDFRPVEPGIYTVRVLTPQLAAVSEERVQSGLNGPLTIRIDGPAVSGPGGVVSAKAQRRPPSKGARKEFRAAEGFAQRGDLQASIEHLQKAVKSSPAFLEAHHNLGVRYFALKDTENACREFTEAVRLDPAFVPARMHLATAYLTAGRIAEAEESARQAARIDPRSMKVRYVLSLTLLAQNKDRQEAMRGLEAASGELPVARLAAAKAYLSVGDVAHAREQLQLYLGQPAVENREKVISWLKNLSR